MLGAILQNLQSSHLNLVFVPSGGAVAGGSAVKGIAEAGSGGCSAAGGAVDGQAHLGSGGASLSGTAVRAIARAGVGGATAAGAVVRSIAKGGTGGATCSGHVVDGQKQAGSGGLLASGSAPKGVARAGSGGAAASGLGLKGISKAGAGGATASGSEAHAIYKLGSGGAVAGGSGVRAFGRFGLGGSTTGGVAPRRLGKFGSGAGTTGGTAPSSRTSPTSTTVALSRILRNDGALYYNPTTFGANPAAPFGGQLLGYVRDVEIRWNARSRRRRSENRAYEIALAGQEADFAFTMLQWDPDVLALGFPRVNVGTSPSSLPGMARVEGGGQPRVIQPLSPILFAPSDPRNLAVLFLRPVPDPVLTARLRLLLSEDAVTPFVFNASLNSSWNSLYVDKLEHMTLA